MKISKKLVMLAAFISFGLFSSSVYASEFNTTTSAATNVKTETITKDDKKIEVITSEDKYIRITQPTKPNTSTFESKLIIMGETRQGTDIVIEVYSGKLDKETMAISKEPKIYKLKSVGITETFNQLIELEEGDNKIVLIYTNDKDKKDKEKMVFCITRESEATKEFIKSYIVYPGTKDTTIDNIQK
jgi:hypothetical protein